MAQNSFALMTNLGRAKEAAALANGTAVVITHIAIGDGTTVPSGGETALYNEIARKAISGHGTVVGASNVAYFDIFLAAAEGPYTIREAGLYDTAGDLIAIARYDPPINKPVPASGQTVEGTVRLEVAFSNLANVTIVVDPSFTIPLQRLSRLPWIPILSMSITAPPASPAIGDAYLIPIGATGAWAGQSGKIAEFTTAGWGIITPPDGHGVSLPDGRVFERIGAGYSEKLALDAQSGKWNYVVAGGTANVLTAALSPVPSAYANGMLVLVGVVTTSTSTTPTLNLNGLGARSIVNPDGSALTAGALVGGAKQLVAFDSTLNKFILMTPANTGVKLGSSWIRHSDGTYEAWGVVTFPGTTTQLDVTLPITFPTSVDSVLVTDVGSSVFVGAANALSTSQIRCWTTPYFVNNTGSISQKNGSVLLWYRAWGK
ncbi:phage tail-collar fiber domain-containing protein [Ochrobactrum chromiisoli]|uniref:Phage tail protein n=1 Tax=Ochrobactrum chromiisoli TaxID=2993941 RepID=A0ABT3QLD8_9HYPH|nr:phage tail protein [Ochrobactrum chromiisoli]MCX2696396.1 phage tail protein [Ochrobactrum chromiisoli]